MSKQADTIDVFSLPVFPAADVFPMMADDELQELATDIGENGLREPIVIANIDVANKETGEVSIVTMLVDGRNRRTACKIARVENPPIRRLNGEDPALFVLSANINRRHMTASQRAITTVAVLLGNSGSNKVQQKLAAITSNTSQSYISQALLVYQDAPDLVPNVISGVTPLKEAYQTMLRRKSDADSEEAKIAKLKKRYPTLAKNVEEGELTLEGAIAEADARDNRKRESLKTHISVCRAALVNVGAFAAEKHAEAAQVAINEILSSDEWMKEFSVDQEEFDRQVTAFRSGVQRLIELLDNLTSAPKKKGMKK